MAETQHRQRRFAALHKFQLRPDAAALYLVLREAMPCAFLDVSSLNLAAFPAAKFLRNRRRRASQKPSGNGHPDVTSGFLRPQGSFPQGGTESTGTPSGPASRVVRLVGTVYCHKAFQKSYSELGSRKGRNSPRATGSGTEKSHRHVSRKSGVLQERQRVRSCNGLRLAKHMCETKSFCNMFRTTARATA